LLLHLLQALSLSAYPLPPQGKSHQKGIIMNKLVFSLGIVALVLLSACSNNPTKSAAEKRQIIIDMRNQVL
jgi:hypothetical protein